MSGVGAGRPRVLVTRAPDDAGPWVEALEAAGFTPVLAPLMDRTPRPPPTPADLAGVDLIVLTSRAAVGALPGALPCPLAAVGPATAEAAEAAGHAVAIVPARATGADLAQALGDRTGQTLLWLTGDRPLPETRTALRATGARVREHEAYRVRLVDDPAGLAGVGAVDLATVASPRVARAYARAGGEAPVVALGPTTALAAREAGLTVVGVADPPGLNGLIAACVAALR